MTTFHVIGEKRIGLAIRTLYLEYTGGYVVTTDSPPEPLNESQAKALYRSALQQIPEWGIAIKRAD